MEPEQPDVKAKPELNIIQAIELAIGHEKEARRYLSLSQETVIRAQDPSQKIAMEEASHEASLQSRLRLYQERHMLRDTFSRYVSPELCEEILKNPGLLALGGRRQQVTVLFADIRNSEHVRSLARRPWWKCSTPTLPKWWIWSLNIREPGQVVGDA
jgi:hypothetical protein